MKVDRMPRRIVTKAAERQRGGRTSAGASL